MIEESRVASVQMLEGTIRGLVQEYGRVNVRAAFDTVIGPRKAPSCNNKACGERCPECNVCASCLCAEHKEAVEAIAKEHKRLTILCMATLNEERQQ